MDKIFLIVSLRIYFLSFYYLVSFELVENVDLWGSFVLYRKFFKDIFLNSLVVDCIIFILVISKSRDFKS